MNLGEQWGVWGPLSQAWLPRPPGAHGGQAAPWCSRVPICPSCGRAELLHGSLLPAPHLRLCPHPLAGSPKGGDRHPPDVSLASGWRHFPSDLGTVGRGSPSNQCPWSLSWLELPLLSEPPLSHQQGTREQRAGQLSNEALSACGSRGVLGVRTAWRDSQPRGLCGGAVGSREHWPERM